MGNKVHELGLLLDEEVEMLMQEADCKSVSGESKSAAAGGAAAGAGAAVHGAAGGGVPAVDSGQRWVGGSRF